MKFVDIIQTASSNMLRSKVRSFLTILAIFIGAFTLTLTNGIGAGVSSYLDNQLGNIGAEDMLIVTAQTSDPISSGPEEYDPDQSFAATGPISMQMIGTKDLEKIRDTDGILSVEPQITPAPDFIEGSNGKKFRITVQSHIEGINAEIASGKPLDANSSDHQLLVTKTYAETLGFTTESAVGKTVSIGVTSPANGQQIVEARIVGVLEQSLISSTAGGQSNTTLSQAIYDIQTTGLPESQKGQSPQVIARIAPDATEDEVQSIKDDLSELGFAGATLDDQIGIIKQVIDAIVLVLNFFAGIALLAASFGIVNTLFMAVQERTKEIGLMKAMGMRSSRVFTLFSIEAIMLGFWGSLLGVFLGMGVGKIINNVAADSFLKDFPGFELLAFPTTSIATIVLIIMTIAFLAGTLPARRASKKDPIEALRYE
mgnify:CR=1 FL=1